MVSVQATCTVDEALGLLKERARTTGKTLTEVADATIDRHIRFGPAA